MVSTLPLIILVLSLKTGQCRTKQLMFVNACPHGFVMEMADVKYHINTI